MPSKPNNSRSDTPIDSSAWSCKKCGGTGISISAHASVMANGDINNPDFECVDVAHSAITCGSCGPIEALRLYGEDYTARSAVKFLLDR